MPTIHLGTHTFRVEQDLIDVTSLHRPDTSWVFIDAKGHEHRWYVEGGGPDGGHISATIYSPTLHYITPTLLWVSDGTYYDEDGEPYETGYTECAQCGERIRPQSTADTHQQMIGGLKRCYIDDEPVSSEAFEQRWQQLVAEQQT